VNVKITELALTQLLLAVEPLMIAYKAINYTTKCWHKAFGSIRRCSCLWAILVALAGTAGLARGASSEASLATVKAVVKAQLGQIQDLSLDYTTTITPKADVKQAQTKSFSRKVLIDTGWFEEASTDQSGALETIHAWNGTLTQYMNVQKNRDGAIARTSAGIHGERTQFPKTSPLPLLGVEGGYAGPRVATLGDYLDYPDVQVEGEAVLDGIPVTIVSCNMSVPGTPRNNAIVFKYWLDLAHGGMPVQFEQFFSGKRSRVATAKLTEVLPNLFFPTEVTTETFGGGDANASELWNKGETTQVKVKPGTVKLNQGLAQRDFTIKFPRGTPVTNEDTGILFYAEVGMEPPTPTDLDELASITAEAKTEYQEDKNQLKEPVINSSKPVVASTKNKGAIAGLGIILIVLMRVITRRNAT
jgi:hypothetical protein